ncbi:type II toxin-antitoxin system VapB family antitoxin (plasmid) [Shinella sp. PSBB067]|uniref:type II toxin-antitoxin system VapB family antitoxin n=1 Tax=Shinella sp. PSBB067 TaxID=2715959 RepID=UPI00193B585C|nr:type II toxin-antitoxin system VapB family antitoxin [Shinella sp. PSBB067]QRI61761.1 type II toxin-antitoxin system VapB family antitoxin [Shinella sp. PSBB067]
MPLYVKDQEVDRLAERLSALLKVSKTEAVRQALARELERVESEPTLADRAKAFVRDLDAKYPKVGPPADKAFIDSLYED